MNSQLPYLESDHIEETDDLWKWKTRVASTLINQGLRISAQSRACNRVSSMLEFISLPDRCSAGEFLAAAASATEAAAERATNAKKWFIVLILTETEMADRVEPNSCHTPGYEHEE